MREIKNSVSPAQSLPSANRTASANGDEVDLKGFDSAVAIADIGLWQDGSHLFKLQETDTPGTGYSDVAAADLVGAFVAVTSLTTDGMNQRVAYIGNKRYIRVVSIQSGSPSVSGLQAAVMVVRAHAAGKPTA